MIYVICGLIGSGKSTFAHEEFTVVLECEDRSLFENGEKW